MLNKKIIIFIAILVITLLGLFYLFPGAVTSSNEKAYFYRSLALLVLLVSSFILFRRDNLSNVVRNASIWLAFFFIFILAYSFKNDAKDFFYKIMSNINPAYIVREGGGKFSINMSNDGHFYLYMNVSGTKVKFLVDTGASDLMLTKEDASRIGINIQDLKYNRIYQTANGKAYGASTVIDNIGFDNIWFSNVRAAVNGGDADISLLGMSFLKRFDSIEFTQDKMILYKN